MWNLQLFQDEAVGVEWGEGGVVLVLQTVEFEGPLKNCLDSSAG